MSEAAEMPKYKCHKEVHALKIDTFMHNKDGRYYLMFEEGSGFAAIEIPADEESKFENISDDDTGYYVVYKGGYRSWSPTKEFKDGYTRI